MYFYRFLKIWRQIMCLLKVYFAFTNIYRDKEKFWSIFIQIRKEKFNMELQIFNDKKI